MGIDEDAFRAKLDAYEQRSSAAQAKAAQAFARLLNQAETRDSGQVRHITQFLAAPRLPTFKNQPRTGRRSIAVIARYHGTSPKQP